MNNVLIVDDSPLARMMIRRCLCIAGLHDASFHEAGDGEEALKLLARQRMDLVVTDLNMPNLDGAGLLASMRKKLSTRRTPVLVLSSLVNDAMRDTLLGDGANAVLKKPVSPQHFLSAFQSIKRAA